MVSRTVLNSRQLKQQRSHVASRTLSFGSIIAENVDIVVARSLKEGSGNKIMLATTRVLLEQSLLVVCLAKVVRVYRVCQSAGERERKA